MEINLCIIHKIFRQYLHTCIHVSRIRRQLTSNLVFCGRHINLFAEKFGANQFSAKRQL